MYRRFRPPSRACESPSRARDARDSPSCARDSLSRACDCPSRARDARDSPSCGRDGFRLASTRLAMVSVHRCRTCCLQVSHRWKMRYTKPGLQEEMVALLHLLTGAASFSSSGLQPRRRSCVEDEQAAAAWRHSRVVSRSSNAARVGTSGTSRICIGGPTCFWFFPSWNSKLLERGFFFTCQIK